MYISTCTFNNPNYVLKTLDRRARGAAGQGGCRSGGLQVRGAAGQGAAGQGGCRSGGLQVRGAAGQGGCIIITLTQNA